MTLVQDPRLALGPDGRNAYGCRDTPEPDLLALGACTASPIATAAWHAMENASPAALDWHALAERWRRAYALEPSTQLYPAPSGTELHERFLASCLPQPCAIITLQGEETGRGIPPLLAAHPGTLDCIALRDAHGQPRRAAEIDHAVGQAVAHARLQGLPILCIALDISKSGLLAPSLACLSALADAPDITLLIDACQGRITPETLRHYLALDAWVALTGSKFIGGPSFSGLLLHRHATLKPQHWPFPSTAESARQLGALSELETLFKLPPAVLDLSLRAFADTVSTALDKAQHLHRFPTPDLARPAVGWDTIPSIFPFALRTALGWATQDDLNHLRASALSGLPGSPRVHLGQTMLLGSSPDGIPALRLSANARWVINHHTDLDSACQTLKDVIQALDGAAGALASDPTAR